MTEQHRPDDRFMELASRFLEGAASAEDLEALDAILKVDERARETLAELLHQHGTLAWTERGQAAFSGSGLKEKFLPELALDAQRPGRAWWMAVPIAACLAIIF